MIRKYFTGSIIFTLVALILSAMIGYQYNSTTGLFAFLWIAIILAVLEISVSLDNAVVNAKVLEDMDAKWRRAFLTWGMLIAVFGMRLIFPIIIVSIAGSITPWEALIIALKQPKEYEALITSVHVEVMAFGGAFLLFVFSAHFLDKEKEVHWIPGIGPMMSKVGNHGTAKLFIPLLIIITLSGFADAKFFIPAVWGMVVYLMVDGLSELFGTPDATGYVARTGLAGFMYLEVVDASFSFDGVIAAFAITNNFLIIMLGLSVGAMFVRSMTIMLVEKGTLNEFRYLEDGAFWGIGWLVFAMFASTLHVEIGEVWIAGGAAVLIALSTFHSIIINKKEKAKKIV